MKITYNDCSSISIDSPVVQSGETIIIKLKKNCCGTEYTKEIVKSVISNDYTIVGSVLTIKSSLFGFTKFEDSVYIFSLYTDISGMTTKDSGCTFIDCETKCHLTELLHKLAEGSDQDIKNGVNLSMLHYGLITTSNCGCNCEDLCLMWKKLSNAINNIDPTKNPYCGC